VTVAPRYEGPAVIDVSAVIAAPAGAAIRQRDRLAATLSGLTVQEWSTPSRCEGWTVQDVAEHLAGVNRFWLVSLASGLGGEPTRLLASFDPVAVPAAMVEGARGAPPDATLEKLAATNAELCALLASLTGSDWHKTAEAPAGHLSVAAVTSHALWDAWIHERDVLVPLGRRQSLEGDEIAVALPYVAALASAFHVNAGVPRRGSLGVRAHDPDMAFTVEVDQEVTVRAGIGADASAVIEGDAVGLVEALSCRAPLPPVTDEHRWLADGLHRVFDPGR